MSNWPQDGNKYTPLTQVATVPASPAILLASSICPALQVLYTPGASSMPGHTRPERISTWLPSVRKEDRCGPYGPGLAGRGGRRRGGGGGRGGRMILRVMGTTVARTYETAAKEHRVGPLSLFWNVLQTCCYIIHTRTHKDYVLHSRTMWDYTSCVFHISSFL